MKIRTDFVTNSSSSSFVVSLRIELRNGRALTFQGSGSCGEGSNSDFYDLKVSVSPKQLARAGSVDELIALLKNGVKDDECKILDENDTERNQMISRWTASGYTDGIQTYDQALSFSQSLALIPKMEDIRSISISGDEQGRYNRYYRKFTYDCDTGSYTQSSRGMPFEKNGGSGGNLVFSDAHEAAIFQFDTLDFLNFKKRIFVLTGFSESKKRELKQLIESKGGEVQESVYQGASYLVVNKDYGRATKKYNDAVSVNRDKENWRNIAIIDESTLQFFAKHHSGWVREGGSPLRTAIKKRREMEYENNRPYTREISYNMIADISSSVKELEFTNKSVDGLMEHALDSIDSLNCIVLHKDFDMRANVAFPVKKAELGAMQLLNSFRIFPKELEVPLEDLLGHYNDSVKKYAAERFWNERQSGKAFSAGFEKTYLDYFETKRKGIVANPTDGAFLLYIVNHNLLTKIDSGILLKQEAFFDLPECNKIILQLAKKNLITKVDAQALLENPVIVQSEDIKALLKITVAPSKKKTSRSDKLWSKKKITLLQDTWQRNELNIAYKYKGNEIEVVIPSELKGIAIDCLGPYAFSPFEDGLDETQIAARRAIKKVVIPDGIRYIDVTAFIGCELEELCLPKTLPCWVNLADIDKEYVRFECCKKSKDYPRLFEMDYCCEICMKGSWNGSKPRNSADYPLSAPAMIEIPEETEKIGDYCFANIPELRKVTLHDRIQSIGAYAFYQCRALESIPLPDSITEIGAHAFDGCEKLKQVTLPEKLTYIGERAFLDCKSLEQISIPDGVTSLEGNGIFFGCESLKEIQLQKHVTNIGECMFYSCKQLKTVTLPESVKRIGESAFAQSGLEEFAAPPRLALLESGVFQSCRALRNVVLNQGLKEIQEETFMGCDALQSIAIPEGVTHIAKYAFWFCSALKDVFLPASLQNIHEMVFGSPDVTVHATKGSYAATEMKRLGFSVCEE